MGLIYSGGYAEYRLPPAIVSCCLTKISPCKNLLVAALGRAVEQAFMAVGFYSYRGLFSKRTNS
jgi:hypothetical protein